MSRIKYPNPFFNFSPAIFLDNLNPMKIPITEAVVKILSKIEAQVRFQGELMLRKCPTQQAA